jgi:O-antigen/teichoic acid export membrane protein
MKLLTSMRFSKPSQAGEGEPLSLRRRVQAGSIFTLGGFGIAQVLRLISNLILTRFLAPEAFGLMSVAVSVNIWAIMLTDIGIASSVIRSRNSDDPDFLRTAWTMQIVRNLLIWVIVLLAAGALYLAASGGAFRSDSIYSDPLLPWIMAAVGTQLAITAVSSINQSMAQRKLAMSRVVGLEIVTQLFTMTVTITFAVLGYGVWALVIGVLAGAVMNTIASHIVFAGPTMRLLFKREHVLEIFHFGKWLIIASFFGFFVNRGDQILFGGLMASDRFGLYAVASIWIVAASGVLQTIVNRIFFPAFSEIFRDRPWDLTKAYKKTRLLVDGGAIFMAYSAFFLSEYVFAFIYPENYSGVGYYVKLLSPFLLLIPFRLVNLVVLAAGDSRNFTGVAVLAGSAMLVLTPTAYHFLGEKAAIVCFAAIETVALPIIWRLGSKYLKIEPATECRVLVAMAVLLILIFTTS